MNVADRPLVTVIVRFYNQAQFVASALDGTLAQVYHPVEVIAVDDAPPMTRCTPAPRTAIASP